MNSTNGLVPLRVPFTEQQLVLLRQLVGDPRYGATVEEVCIALFRDYAEQLFGTEEQAR
jgi:hypothetical protein